MRMMAEATPNSIFIMLMNIHCLLELNMLCKCVTRGCGDHSPLTTASILG